MTTPNATLEPATVTFNRYLSAVISNASAETDLSTLFQLYCVNPPQDGCEFGPCPNPDVTGTGQQISRESAVFKFHVVSDT
jgi:hypothetical protein